MIQEEFFLESDSSSDSPLRLPHEISQESDDEPDEHMIEFNKLLGAVGSIVDDVEKLDDKRDKLGLEGKEKLLTNVETETFLESESLSESPLLAPHEISKLSVSSDKEQDMTELNNLLGEVDDIFQDVELLDKKRQKMGLDSKKEEKKSSSVPGPKHLETWYDKIMDGSDTTDIRTKVRNMTEEDLHVVEVEKAELHHELDGWFEDLMGQGAEGLDTEKDGEHHGLDAWYENIMNDDYMKRDVEVTHWKHKGKVL